VTIAGVREMATYKAETIEQAFENNSLKQGDVVIVGGVSYDIYDMPPIPDDLLNECFQTIRIKEDR
jgi:hypothetical protein